MAEQKKPINHSSGLPFRDLVQYLLQPLQDYTRRPGIKGRPGVIAPSELKRVAISKFLARWRTEVGDDVFPFFRLLMPERDKDRSMYKIKEANMAKLFIKILGISPASEDAISIEKWKIPGVSGAAGDFPGRLFEVLRSRAAIPDWGNMSIDEVNEGLDQLSRCSKESQQRPILTKFYNNMSAQELRWLCCIILRTMKIGASERTFFDIWHPDAHKLFNKSSSLSRVCWELYDREYRLPDAEKDISVFSCFQPQLAAFRKSDIADVVKKMGGKTFYIEEKLDGERIQLHKRGDIYKYWSRKAKDYTYLYGSSYGDDSNQEGGGLTKYLEDAFNPAVKNVVLDGEMITWNDKFDAPVGFGSLKSAANAEKNNSNSSFDGHPFYCVFDILYLNGTSLTNYTLRDRRKALKGIIRPITRRIEVVPVQEANKEFEVESRLRECIANASEGLVVKDPDSAYRPNDRNDSWIKVKPEYMEEFGENLDLLIIGGYWGEGRRGNRLSSFLCGVREDNPASEDPLPRFMTFARVGGGFNGPDYAQIDHITTDHWHKFDPQDPPSQHYSYARGRNGTLLEYPDMWIAPEHSVVIQLKAASAVPSDSYAAKVTLRFPRFERLREDKDWRTATSLKDFVNIQAQAASEKNEKLLNAHIRRKRTVAGQKKKFMTIQGVEDDEPEESIKDSLIFDRLSFYVLTDSRDHKLSKHELEALIRDNGGQIVHNEGEPRNPPSEQVKALTPAQKLKRDAAHLDTMQEKRSWTEVFNVAERNVVKVASLVKRATHDIMKPEWLVASIAAGRLLDREPRFMYFTTQDSVQSVQSNVDEYNDSYTNDITVPVLTLLLQQMPKGDVDVTEVQELREFLVESGDFPMWMFSRFVAYFNYHSLAHQNHISVDHHKEDESAEKELEDAEVLWKLHGGQVTYDIHDTRTTHVIVSPQSTANLRKIRAAMALRDRIARVVAASWINKCTEAETVLGEEGYAVR